VATAKHTAVAIKLTCATGKSFCAGTVEVVAVAREVGKRRFRIHVGRTKLILVKLWRKPLKRVSPRGPVTIFVTATARDAGGGVTVARRRVQLRLRVPPS